MYPAICKLIARGLSWGGGSVWQLAAGLSGGTVPVRGGRGKARKAMRQYAHQDEEDRQLAMAALSSAGDAFAPIYFLLVHPTTLIACRTLPTV